jgi:8-oxo-dGTP diphosphatase
MTETSSTMNSAQFRIGVSGLLFDQSRILLAHRRDIDWWNLPGGGMELGETVEDAVKREFLEETGLEVEVEQLVGVYSKPQKQEVVLAFLCRKIGGVLTETEESRECRYFALNDLPVNTLPKHRQRIQDALLGQERAVLRAQLSSSAEDQRLSPL